MGRLIRTGLAALLLAAGVAATVAFTASGNRAGPAAPTPFARSDVEAPDAPFDKLRASGTDAFEQSQSRSSREQSSDAPGAPTRVVSLNLCTDELALELAAPGQLASVSFLGADPAETPLAPRARGLPTNTGRLDSVIALEPDLVITGGPMNRYAAELARRLGIPVLDLPPPSSLADVRANIRALAAALGRPAAGEALIARMDAELGVPPVQTRSALLLGGGGTVAQADGLAAALLRHAGLVQQPGSGTIALERLLTNPPQVLLITDYRSAQASLGQSWLAHPALRRLPATTTLRHLDGRAWTCMGPAVAGEVAALRSAAS